MSNCSAVKEKVAAAKVQNQYLLIKKALEFYSLGTQGKKENFQKRQNILKGGTGRSRIAFAWDNLGISQRRLNNYDKIFAYSKSLAIDPNS
jgi:hypothetical protein